MNKIDSMSKSLLTTLLLCVNFMMVYAQQLAFPGAEGFGRFAVGGRGGTVYHVTNLNDSGEGSLRDAVSQPHRIVVFDVAGVIHLKSRLSFKNNLYVAGQTAPGDGITVYGNAVSFSGADNTIVRYIRFRMGVDGDSGKDACSVSSGRNMMFDHLSVSWGRDETFSISRNDIGNLGDITIQNSIIAQGLVPHSAGGLIQAHDITLYRNLYVNNNTRNNKFKGRSQYVNNIVYNWQSGCYIMGGNSQRVSHANVENNLFIKGPVKGGSPFTRANANYHIYENENYVDENRDGVLNPIKITREEYQGPPTFHEQPFDYPTLPQWSAKELVDSLLPMVGASLPYRDYADWYVLNDAYSLGTSGELISDEKTLPFGSPLTWDLWQGEARQDTDKDGMPDSWENKHGTNPNLDDAMVLAENGYANIENYINGITKADRQYHLRTPICVRCIDSTKNSVKLTWLNYSEFGKKIIVELKEKGKKFRKACRVDASASETTLTKLKSGKTYIVRLKVEDDKGNVSEYSPELEIVKK